MAAESPGPTDPTGPTDPPEPARFQAVAEHVGVTLDQGRITGIIEDLLQFDEHTWGRSGTATTPWSAEHRLHWWEKRQFAARAGLAAHQLEADLLQHLSAPGGFDRTRAEHFARNARVGVGVAPTVGP